MNSIFRPTIPWGTSSLAMMASGVESGVSADSTVSLTMDEPTTGVPDKAQSEADVGVTTEPGTDADAEDHEDGDEEGNATDDEGAGDDTGDTDGPLEDLGEYSDERHDEFDQRYRAEDGSLNEAVLTAEFDQNGGKGLNEGTYAYFEALGFPKAFVKQIEQGQAELRNKAGDAIVKAAGGADALNAAVAWGKKAYTPEQRARFNRIMQGSDQEAKLEAVEALMRRHGNATGRGPRKRSVPNNSATGGKTVSETTGRGFATRAEWLEARAKAKGKPIEEARVNERYRHSNIRAWKDR